MRRPGRAPLSRPLARGRLSLVLGSNRAGDCATRGRVQAAAGRPGPRWRRSPAQFAGACMRPAAWLRGVWEDPARLARGRARAAAAEAIKDREHQKRLARGRARAAAVHVQRYAGRTASLSLLTRTSGDRARRPNHVVVGTRFAGAHERGRASSCIGAALLVARFAGVRWLLRVRVSIFSALSARHACVRARGGGLVEVVAVSDDSTLSSRARVGAASSRAALRGAVRSARARESGGLDSIRGPHLRRRARSLARASGGRS